jgi:LPS-assembly lipoprotein
MTGGQMTRRRTLLGMALGLVLGLGLSGLSGCGWTPLYADPETGPADAELRAIRVDSIPERFGQRLALALRESLNPTGEATPQHYILRITLQVVRLDLGVQTQGLGTRGRLDAFANFTLSDNKSGAQLLAGSSHVAESFDILANEYSNVVAEDDANIRSIEELRRDLLSRLTLFLQRRVAEHAANPGGAKPVTP